uniref:Uncharacterized protein n=1 Tax=Acrobeloides nanus TaxID=290746 RepID=A0A914DNZ0_9BILA
MALDENEIVEALLQKVSECYTNDMSDAPRKIVHRVECFIQNIADYEEEDIIDIDENADDYQEDNEKEDTRKFYKYTFAQYEDIVDRYFGLNHSFDNVKHSRRKLTDESEMYRSGKKLANSYSKNSSDLDS